MPRLPLRGEPADTVLRFRVTRREYATITAYACANSVTVSQVIAEAVAEYASDLADPATPSDIDPPLSRR